MTSPTGKVLYESIDEYNQFREEFNVSLPQLIRDNHVDDWIYTDYGSVAKKGIKFSNRFENVLFGSLSRLTKNQVPDWTKNTANILSDAIRGMAKSVSRMINMQHSISVCSDCETEDVVEMDTAFENREICNIMIVGMINNVLFDTEGEDAGSDSGGMLKKIRLFECEKCSKLVDNLFDGELCISCVDCDL